MIRERIDGLVCDLDGVIYRGDHAIDGSARTINALRADGIRVLFCTNNSRSTVEQYVERLAGFDIEATPDEIITSAIVTASVVGERGYSGKTAIVVGGDGIKEALSDVCVGIKEDPAVRKADLVVVGWDPRFDYSAMTRAADAVRAGAAFIATNTDAAFPAPTGLWPGAGAILASIETASGRKAEVMGKPHAPMLDAVAARMEGCRSIAVVGDRPETDLAGAPERGWKTILVLSGVTRREDVDALDPRPDLVLAALTDLVSELSQ
jgi:4-nitrophenyl phosphatase